RCAETGVHGVERAHAEQQVGGSRDVEMFVGERPLDLTGGTGAVETHHRDLVGTVHSRPRLGYAMRVSDELPLGPVLRVGKAEVRVGTCSWTDKTLVNDTKWYPKKTMSAAERLAFYAARFPVVEADSTYYRPPSEQLATGWAERTPP